MPYSATVSKLAIVCGLRGAIISTTLAEDLLDNSAIEVGEGNIPAAWRAAAVPSDGLRMERVQRESPSEGWSLSISNATKYERLVSNNWCQAVESAGAGRLLKLSASIRTEQATAAHACSAGPRNGRCWAS